MDDVDDQRNAVLDVIFETQQRIARKHQENLESAAAAGATLVGASSGGSAGGHAQPAYRVNTLDAKNHRSEFFTVWSAKIDAFVSDASKTSLDLPPELSANDRRELHALADKFNLSHLSEGTGRERHLVLRKDLLHYKAPQLRPTNAAMEALKAGSQQKPKQDSNGQRTVESRYELKRVRHRDEELKYGSDAVERAVRRLDKATDHFRNATEVGMTMEEYQREESGASIDALLASGGSATATDGARRGAPSAPAPSSAAAASAWSDALVQRPQEILAGATPKQYVEKCLTCGSQSPLDYDVAEWGCCGFCDVCNKERIFRLVEVIAAPVPEEIDRSDDDEDVRPPTAKQHRVETAGSPTVVAVEEIDRDDDEIADGAVVSAEEAVNILSMNDVPDRDTKYLHAFAQVHEASGDLGRSLLFAMDFQDVVGGDDPILAPFTRRANSETMFVMVRGVMAEQRVVVHATAVIPEVAQALGLGSSEMLQHAVIVAPSTSLYGTALQLLVRLEGVKEPLDVGALQKLTTAYGSSNIRYGRADALRRVVQGS